MLEFKLNSSKKDICQNYDWPQKSAEIRISRLKLIQIFREIVKI